MDACVMLVGLQQMGGRRHCPPPLNFTGEPLSSEYDHKRKVKKTMKHIRNENRQWGHWGVGGRGDLCKEGVMHLLSC